MRRVATKQPTADAALMARRRAPCTVPGALAALLLAVAGAARADVLPEERADASWRMYEGGGLRVTGPSVLVRKNFGDQVSVTAGYLVDQVSGASIDMLVQGASPLREERKQKSLGVEYLRGRTTYSVGVLSSIENDYDSSTVNASIAQAMFGDLTTVTFGASRGWDIVTKRILGPLRVRDPNPCHDTSSNPRCRVDRKSWSLGLSQILTRNLIGGLDYEAITEQGYLQNPYREIRYVSGRDAAGNPATYSMAEEHFPGTHTTNSAALRLKYFLPWHAALTGKYRYSSDTWDIRAQTLELGYTQPLFKEALIADLTARHYKQGAASFYSDLFPSANFQNYMGRDRELAAQKNDDLGVAFSYDLLKSKLFFLRKASVSLHYDYISYRYDDFRDARVVPGVAPGSEPLYRNTASVIQASLSGWF
jgi:hypothetical protein